MNDKISSTYAFTQYSNHDRLVDQIIRPLESLPGVGPKTALLLRRLFPNGTCLEICLHKPTGQMVWQNLDALPTDKSAIYTLNDQFVRLPLTIISHLLQAKGRKTTQIKCRDNLGNFIYLIFFHLSYSQLKSMVPLGESRMVAGKIEWSYTLKQWQIIHPEIISANCPLSVLETKELIYPLTAGISQKMLRKCITAALKTVSDLPEWLEPHQLSQKKWPSWRESIVSLHHFPPLLNGLTRLAYDELLAEQLALAQMRRHRQRFVGRSFKSGNHYTEQFLKNLPFALTRGQMTVIDEITQNLESPYQMMRLLQGDVGSGKTIVAMASILKVIDSGAQCALLVPTEILARQHMATFTTYLEPLGITGGLFIGKITQKEGDLLRKQLEQGHIKVAIGTHALLEDRIIFKDLGLVIIDEQHRFGVEQRQKICLKGKSPDVLLMTATPIPRSLQMTVYGDVDISFLREKPHDRQPLVTSILDIDRLEFMINELRRPLEQGDQIYWVCPLVEESEVLDLIAAQTRFESLQQLFGSAVALIHGKMKPIEKSGIMEGFKKGEIKILVATTVIEVGVDVPNATIMVIEHAERFGLAQLHQLRGRVGRGHKQSHCLLLAPTALGEVAKQRLKVMKDTQDGFYIADMDLKLRGAGETLGKRQSGLPVYRVADLDRDADLLPQAFREAQEYLGQDPLLEQERGLYLRILLRLFGYNLEEVLVNPHLV